MMRKLFFLTLLLLILPHLAAGQINPNYVIPQGTATQCQPNNNGIWSVCFFQQVQPLTPTIYSHKIVDQFGLQTWGTGHALWVYQPFAPPAPLPTFSAANSLVGFTNAAITTAVDVKKAPASLYAWVITNTNTSPCFLDFFNTLAASVVLGTTKPAWTIGVPASAGANVAPGGFPFTNFPSSMSVAAVTASGGSSTCATGLTVSLSIF